MNRRDPTPYYNNNNNVKATQCKTSTEKAVLQTRGTVQRQLNVHHAYKMCGFVEITGSVCCA